jgi:hypothetical protein
MGAVDVAHTAGPEHANYFVGAEFYWSLGDVGHS